MEARRISECSASDTLFSPPTSERCSCCRSRRRRIQAERWSTSARMAEPLVRAERTLLKVTSCLRRRGIELRTMYRHAGAPFWGFPKCSAFECRAKTKMGGRLYLYLRILKNSCNINIVWRIYSLPLGKKSQCLRLFANTRFCPWATIRSGRFARVVFCGGGGDAEGRGIT